MLSTVIMDEIMALNANRENTRRRYGSGLQATGLEKNGGGVGIVPPGFGASIFASLFIASINFKKLLGKINSDKKREEREMAGDKLW
ncbi:hypothetical protein D5086_013177 [Populus alba]|uniref:Uncharacterized protein n=1 Tax=Populus alba TaxID=43335 RepID=A0ACC4C5S8_POPAL